MKPLKYISLFSGIEAATVAWKPLGWKPIAFAEIDPFPKAVLARHYPGVPDLGDMTKVDWSKYNGTVDIVVGGSPCQAFSIAGLRKALDDPRGQLMLEYLRACHGINPEWIVWENVPGVLSADGGRAFGSLLASVAELWPDGGAAWRVLDAHSTEWHSDADVSSLSSTLETGDVPHRYYLSAKACAGIINRAKQRGKPLPHDLVQALERQLAALTARQDSKR